jgi:hypothetical protein
MNPDSNSGSLGRLVGTWTTAATHPAVPGVVVHGTAVIEWLEGERFLMHRARTDHPDFPDALSVIGHMGARPGRQRRRRPPGRRRRGATAHALLRLSGSVPGL